MIIYVNRFNDDHGCFYEFFDNGINDYSVYTGNTNPFSTASGVLSSTITSDANNNSYIYRTIGSHSFKTWTFEFRLRSRNPDDGGVIVLKYDTSFRMYFNPRREPAMVGGQDLSLFNLNGNDSYLPALAINIWYRGEVLLQTGSGSYARVINTTDESLVGSIIMALYLRWQSPD